MNIDINNNQITPKYVIPAFEFASKIKGEKKINALALS